MGVKGKWMVTYGYEGNAPSSVCVEAKNKEEVRHKLIQYFKKDDVTTPDFFIFDILSLSDVMKTRIK